MGYLPTLSKKKCEQKNVIEDLDILSGKFKKPLSHSIFEENVKLV